MAGGEGGCLGNLGACGWCPGLRAGRMPQTAQTFSDRPQSLQRDTKVCQASAVMHFHMWPPTHVPSESTLFLLPHPIS